MKDVFERWDFICDYQNNSNISWLCTTDDIRDDMEQYVAVCEQQIAEHMKL